jgi:lipopolysaccharide export system permease protein
MKLIERYIFRRVFTMALSALMIATGIVLTTQLLAQVDMVTRSADAAANFAVIALMFVPMIGLLVAPFALLVGAMRTLSAMNSDSELAVLEAAGRRPSATARPIVLLAALTTLASLATSLTVEPWANRTMQDTIEAASADLIRSAVQSGSFVPVQGGTFIQIGTELPSGEFGQVVIVDTRDPITELIYYARRGTLLEHQGASLFVLADGEVHRRNKLDRSVSIISFATTALDFSQFVSRGGRVSYRPEELPTGYLLSPDSKDPLARDRPAELRREIHRRFSEWLYPMVFGLVAVYFAGSARSNRQDQPAQIVIGALVALSIRALGFFTVANSGESPIFAALTYAVPLGAIAVFGGLILRGRTMRIPKRMMEGAGQATDGTLSRMAGAMRFARAASGKRLRP